MLAQSGSYRAALTLDWYAGNEKSQRALMGQVPAIDRARTYLARGPTGTRIASGRAPSTPRPPTSTRPPAWWPRPPSRASAAVISPGPARSGSRLAHLLSSSGSDFYAAGLARFNLARTSRRTGDKAAAREAVVAAVHLLEEAADRYETIGQRERAFDCYQVLIAVGRESQEFEHVLEAT